jgi:hypothetical protein
MSFDRPTHQWVRTCTVAGDFNFTTLLNKASPLLPANPS